MVSSSELAFVTEVALQKQILILRYRVENHAAKDAYLVNVLFRPLPRWNVSPDLIYVRVNADSGLISLCKSIDRIPDGWNVVCPVSPFLTPLRTGGRFSEEVHIPIPVEEYREYNPLRCTGRRNLACNSVQFTLGYYWACQGIKEEILDLDGFPAHTIKVPPGTILEFQELRSSIMQADVPAVIQTWA